MVRWRSQACASCGVRTNDCMRGRGIVLRDRKFEWHWRQGGPDCTAIGHLYIWNPKKGPSSYAIARGIVKTGWSWLHSNWTFVHMEPKEGSFTLRHCGHAPEEEECISKLDWLPPFLSCCGCCCCIWDVGSSTCKFKHLHTRVGQQPFLLPSCSQPAAASGWNFKNPVSCTKTLRRHVTGTQKWKMSLLFKWYNNLASMANLSMASIPRFLSARTSFPSSAFRL